jgi:hypothetical protein
MHDMILIQTYPTGAEDWLCPICGYRFIMRWEPFRRITLIEGDQSEPHQGVQGGLALRGVMVEEDVTLDPKIWGSL